MSKRSEIGINHRRSNKAPVLCSWLLAIGLSVVYAGAGVMQPVFADDKESLSKLEDKYFQTAFPKDETGERVERLEKLVFGEARSGSLDERIKSLVDLLPADTSQAASEPPPSSSGSSDSAYSGSGSSHTQASEPKGKSSEPLADESDEPITNASSYPAVTAIEKKLLGRDYVGDSVGKRIDRLEIKAFGKTSASDDLQDRVDRLRKASGVDTSKMKPLSSDWADEEEDPRVIGADGVQPFSGIPGGADDPSLQRNYRKQQAMNPYGSSRPSYDPYAGTGTFGGSSGYPSSSGSSGTFGGGLGSSSVGAGMPPSAPDFSGRSPQAASPAPAMGISQQLALLEKEVFNKTYDKEKQETILTRLNRLESNIFPQDKSSASKSLPERVSRLVAAVPIASSMPPTAPPKRGGKDPDFPDLDFNGPGTLSQRNPGGLSKIINGLGSALSGGFTGGYATPPGTLITDPSTGLLYDQYTGTLIDPMTGAVVGRRTVTTGGYNYPNYGGFNSGLSPMTPFGSVGGSGMNFGFGGGGIRFGGWP